MKSLYKFTQERVEQMDGKQLDAINQGCYTHDAFYERLAEIITDSTAFREWENEIFEDPQNIELSDRLSSALQRFILNYIKENLTDLIDDRIYDYVDQTIFQDDKHAYYGLSEKNIVGV